MTISREKARSLIENNEKYTDAQIDQITRNLDALANILFDMWLRDRNKSKVSDKQVQDFQGSI